MSALSREEDNYLRVYRTLSIEGLTVLKDILLGKIGGTSNLQATLRFSQDKLMALTETKVLTRAQLDALYPKNGVEATDLSQLDVITMCQLLKTVTIGGPDDINWDQKPKAHQIQKYHDVVRIKFIAEELNKSKNKRLTKIEFDYYWREVNRILIRLGVDAKVLKLYEIENLATKQYQVQRDKIDKIINADQIANSQTRSRCGSCCTCCLVLLMAGVALFVYLIATFTVQTGYGYIDYSKCTTITANWGQTIHCPEGFVVTGSCGAGEDGDCPGGTWLHLKCCPVVNYIDDPNCDKTKQKFRTFYNEHKSCPGTSLLTGGCASGKDADCEGQFNTLYCQNDCRLTVDTQSCSWSGAGWGQYKECGQNQVLKGRCGAGRDADCSLHGHHYWMLIECCNLMHRDRSTYEKFMIKAKKTVISYLDVKSDEL